LLEASLSAENSPKIVLYVERALPGPAGILQLFPGSRRPPSWIKEKVRERDGKEGRRGERVRKGRG